MARETAPRESAANDARRYMARALELAARGEGFVEPNPMVGCVIVRDDQTVGEGFHARYGGPHAEVVALRAAGEAARGADLYVTLEPCCHHGKTPPCTEAVIAAGVARVFAAVGDPFPRVAGGGLKQLEEAGIEVSLGVCEAESRALNAPYFKRLSEGRPWVLAKWAMTLDGKIAAASGDSQWISGEASRAVVHALRGRVDAILVGGRTAERDDPLLTARPPGPRTALRIVVDTRGELSPASRLATTAGDFPTLLACGPEAPKEKLEILEQLGCEVFVCEGETQAERLDALLLELGRREITNLLVEGGGELLGVLFDAGMIDEVHAFLAPKLIGGRSAPTPLAGIGLAAMADARGLVNPVIEQLEGDIYIHGRL